MESIWARNCVIPERDRLDGDIEVETAVIGAGMAGILTAYRLKEAGVDVAVLEADRIAGGQTRNTTAKITSQHGLNYKKLLDLFGEEKARQYAEANETAISEYFKIADKLGIECGLERVDSFVYGDKKELEAEVRVARSLGLPASFVRGVKIPIKAEGAVRFKHQAQFDPLAFIKPLSENVKVYEHTRVLSVEDGKIETEHGTVKAKNVIFACHFPFVNFPGMYFARMHQERSYVLALKNAGNYGGVWIGAEKNSRSFRNYGELLLYGGAGHRTGKNSEGGRYDILRAEARELFPESVEIAHWSAQDCITPDGVPYIGRFAESRPNWFVATGFNKWGMTSSMVASMIIGDMVCGRNSRFAEVFDPSRFELETVSGVAMESGQAIKGLAKRFFQIPDGLALEIPAGHGGIVMLDGEKVGVYKDEDGKLYSVDVACPHLGCQLEWNPDEKSWDCPCHGSRFDRFGRLLSSPAQRDI